MQVKVLENQYGIPRLIFFFLLIIHYLVKKYLGLQIILLHSAVAAQFRREVFNESLGQVDVIYQEI